MQVILTARMSNLGQIGEIVTVKSGYAKNFLIPQKKAIVYNNNNYKFFEAKKKEFEMSNSESMKIAESIKAKIADKNIIIIENASDDGRLYGSVTTATIAHKINEITKTDVVNRSIVVLNKPIKEIGVYQVSLDIHGDVKISAKVVVAKAESEVEAVLAAANKGSKFVEETPVENTQSEEKKPKKSKKTKAEAEKTEAAAE